MKMYVCMKMCDVFFYVLCVLGMGIEDENSGNLWHGNACSHLCLLEGQWLAFWRSSDLLLCHTQFCGPLLCRLVVSSKAE